MWTERLTSMTPLGLSRGTIISIMIDSSPFSPDNIKKLKIIPNNLGRQVSTFSTFWDVKPFSHSWLEFSRKSRLVTWGKQWVVYPLKVGMFKPIVAGCPSSHQPTGRIGKRRCENLRRPFEVIVGTSVPLVIPVERLFQLDDISRMVRNWTCFGLKYTDGTSFGFNCQRFETRWMNTVELSACYFIYVCCYNLLPGRVLMANLGWEVLLLLA